MPSFNQVILLGNLTRDIELRHTPKGTAVAQFGLAINRSWKGEDGQKHEEVLFVDCNAFGRQAETLQKHVHKGEPLFIQGRLRREEWEKDGVKKSATRVVVEEFQFIGRRPAEAKSESDGGTDGPPF